MDKRIKYFVGLDTETCNTLQVPMVYDIGWRITDKRGIGYVERSYIVKEVFEGMADVMTSAYYANKIPQYLNDIITGKCIVATFAEIRKQLIADMEDYNCNIVFAHNARFDLNALNTTQRYLSKSKYRYFFPYGTEIWDTLKMADVIAQQKSYKAFCERHGFMTKHKNPRVQKTAEVLYRYITGNIDFAEAHTGLEDVRIESVILAHCFRQHKKMRKELFAKG